MDAFKVSWTASIIAMMDSVLNKLNENFHTFWKRVDPYFDPSNLVFFPKVPTLDFHQFLQYLSEKRAVKCKIQ
jgi:hypothetical protein